MRYRFERLDWSAAEKMSAKLNELVKGHERVVNVSTTRDEVLVLIEDLRERRKAEETPWSSDF